MKVTGLTEDTVKLLWEDPRDDGGSMVTGFVIQRREGGKRVWQDVAETGDMETKYEVTGLTEGTTYNFQVAAVNEVGVGAFAELSKAVAPKSQHGNLLNTLSTLQFSVVHNFRHDLKVHL